MKATVVVSCYNQQDYIRESMDSILSQETDFEFDVLVSDDHSTDATPAILREFGERYPEKVRLVLRKRNLGAAKNYIQAHQATTGDVVFHFDGDDVMLPGKLQAQFEVFRKHKDVNIVFHRAEYFSDDGSYCARTGSPAGSADGILLFDRHDLARWGSITVHSAYAYRRASRSTFDPGREFMEWFFAMDSLIPSGQGVYLDRVLTRYRCNPAGAAYLSTRPGRIKSYLIYFRDLEFYFGRCPELRRELYANHLFSTMAMLRSGCGWAPGAPGFLLRNLAYFRPNALASTFRMRKAVAPATRVR